MVAVADIRVDDVHEFADTGHGEAPELAIVELTEETLHEIQPGGAGGNEVEVDAGMSLQPTTHLLVFVRGVVVEDDMDIESGLHRASHGLDELQELLMAVPRHAVVDHMAGGDLKSREQGGRCTERPNELWDTDATR